MSDNVIKLTPRSAGHNLEHPATDKVTIAIHHKTLSDGSVVYDLRIGGVELHAIDRKHADTLAATIAEAIDIHTVDFAELVKV